MGCAQGCQQAPGAPKGMNQAASYKLELTLGQLVLDGGD